MSDRLIFVSLLNEGVDVWRPVAAERVAGDVYRIADQPYDATAETWEFEPGAIVACERVETQHGSILAATRLATSTEARRVGAAPCPHGSIRTRVPDTRLRSRHGR